MFFIRMMFLMAIFSRAAAEANQKPKVVVIGAGLAGLTAAYRLQQGGMDVDLYEARGRVGGRIFTVSVNGRHGELGAQNITDGGEAFHLHRLIEELGLSLTTKKLHLNHSYFDGEGFIPITQRLQSLKFDPKTLKERLRDLAKTASNMKEIFDQLIDPSDPLYPVLAVRLAAYEGATVNKLSLFYIETLYHMLLGGMCSVHQGNGDKETYIDLVGIEGGNARLPESLAEKLEGRIHLNRPLIRVAKQGDGSFLLTFKGGEEAIGDFLVLAMPCPVYRNISFEGDVIPQDRLQRIQDVPYGTNAKILVPFTTPPSTRQGIMDDRLICFFDAERTTLTLYYTGETSGFAPETIRSSYLEARAMVEKGFKESCPPFEAPQYALDKNFLDYDTPVGYSWPKDLYAGGSYSYISPGQESRLTELAEVEGETYKSLFAPVGRSLYFAGEHASILLDVAGTMEAACESGERVARVLLQRTPF